MSWLRSVRACPDRLALWQAWLLVGSVLIVGYQLLPRAAMDVGYCLLCVVFLAVAAVGVRRYAMRRGPWWVLLAGVGCLVAGDLLYSGYPVLLGQETPFPSWADAAYLASYPMMALGALRLVRARTGGADRGSLIDAAILAVSAAVLSWVFLMAPQASDTATPLSVRLVTLAYPVGDLVILGVLARLALLPGREHPVLRLLAASLVLLVASDTGYAVLVLHGSYEQGSVVDVGWLFWYALVGAATLHPRMGELTEPVVVGHQRLTPSRLALLAGASLLPPVLLAGQAAWNQPLELPVVVSATVVLFLLVLVRLAGLVHEVDDARRVVTATLEQLREAQAERRGLLDRTLRAGEEERKRLAAELHDGPVQRLTGLGYRLDRASLAVGRGDSAGAALLLTELQTELTAETRALRRVMSALRPPVLAERGLVRAVQDHLRELATRSDLQVEVDLQVRGRVDPQVETALFRVVQEATRNVEKHAAATHLHVALIPHQRGVQLQIRDDGRGFDTSRGPTLAQDGHYGLIGMRERVEMAGGTWQIDSAPGSGTTLTATLQEDST